MSKRYVFCFLLLFSLLFAVSCSDKNNPQSTKLFQKNSSNADAKKSMESVVNFSHTLDSYSPKKKEYNFYFTYKLLHPWWDAVVMGMDDAVLQLKKNGVIVTFDYLAPETVSARNQVSWINAAADTGEYDVIGVDVADIDVVSPAINRILDHGQKVMTFSSSDAGKEDGCRRIAYVGNTHNYEDGYHLAEALCQKLNFKGEIALIIGTKGAPCHEERAKGVKDVIEQYPEMRIVATGWDDDIIENSYTFTKETLASYPNVKGFICCNMCNPVGAARAVIELHKESEIVIVGMDHDEEALEYLSKGVIYALGIQDCYSMGFDTIQVAIKIADGIKPGELYPEKTEEKTTIVYQNDAEVLLKILYGKIN